MEGSQHQPHDDDAAACRRLVGIIATAIADSNRQQNSNLDHLHQQSTTTQRHNEVTPHHHVPTAHSPARREESIATGLDAQSTAFTPHNLESAPTSQMTSLHSMAEIPATSTPGRLIQTRKGNGTNIQTVFPPCESVRGPSMLTVPASQPKMPPHSYHEGPALLQTTLNKMRLSRMIMR